ncbi:MAG: hypothetical protein GF400_02020 [Candidatus Eisenbacteria bacterium]|nr:hypothetical protein [Candidatus Eisenbacteria bacterium]
MDDSRDTLSAATLGSGLAILAERRPGAGVFSVLLSLEAGSRYDTDERAGLASLAAGLMVEGTASSAGQDLALRVDSLGATLDVSVDYEVCEISLTGLSDRFEDCLRVLGEVVREPRLRTEDLERARRKQLAEIDEDQDDPFTLARNAFLDLVYGAHPRHRPVSGSRDSVSGLGLADVEAFRDAFYVPAGAVLAAVGDLEPQSFVAGAEREFGSWIGRPPSRPRPESPRRAGGRRRFIHKDRKQTHVMLGGIGVARSDPLYPAVSIMDVVLGDSAGFGSRLGRRLREGEGLAYVVESDAASTAGIDPGVVWIYTATSPSRAGRALDVVREELQLLGRRPPSLDELAQARAYLLGRRLREGESCEELAARLVRSERYHLGRDYDSRYADLLASVTRERVQEAAAKLLDPERHACVVVGPSSPWDDH